MVVVAMTTGRRATVVVVVVVGNIIMADHRLAGCRRLLVRQALALDCRLRLPRLITATVEGIREEDMVVVVVVDISKVAMAVMAHRSRLRPMAHSSTMVVVARDTTSRLLQAGMVEVEAIRMIGAMIGVMAMAMAMAMEVVVVATVVDGECVLCEAVWAGFAKIKKNNA